MAEKTIRFALRDTAKVCLISWLNKGAFAVGDEGRSAAVSVRLDSEDIVQISKVHIIGTIASKQAQGSITNFLIDDGTDSILCRFFEATPLLETLFVGDVVRIIGRVREYNLERYVFPDAVTKVDSLWLKWLHLKLGSKHVERIEIDSSLEQKETSSLREEKTLNSDDTMNVAALETAVVSDLPVVSKMTNGPLTNNKVAADTPQKKSVSSAQQLLAFISSQDTGNGVFIEDILANASIDNAAIIVERMIETGDLFQNMPGKVKVL